MTVESLEQFRRAHSRSIERLYRQSGGAAWNLSEGAFADASFEARASGLRQRMDVLIALFPEAAKS